MKMKWTDYLDKRQNKIYPTFLGLGYRIDCDYKSRHKEEIIPAVLGDNRQAIYDTMIKTCADAYEFQDTDNLKDLKIMIFCKREIDNDLLTYLREKCVSDIEKISETLSKMDGKNNTRESQREILLRDKMYSIETVLRMMLERILAKIVCKSPTDKYVKNILDLNLSNIEKKIVLEECCKDKGRSSETIYAYRNIADIIEKYSEMSE